MTDPKHVGAHFSWWSVSGSILTGIALAMFFNLVLFSLGILTW